MLGCSRYGPLRTRSVPGFGRSAGRAAATILHADLDAFYASVEQLYDPSLRGKPIAVGGGVVLAASYEAKAFGVRSGMPGRRARELCPELRFVSGHFDAYQRLGDAAIDVLGDFTPLGGSILVVGVIFVALAGRLLLPKMKADRGRHHSQRSLRARYKLQEQTFMMRVPMDSILVGKTLSDTRIGSATGLIILALVRFGRRETLPSRQRSGPACSRLPEPISIS